MRRIERQREWESGQAPRPQHFANTCLTHFMGEFHEVFVTDFPRKGAGASAQEVNYTLTGYTRTGKERT